MFVQNYQIRNVLNVYRRQLSQRMSGQSRQAVSQRADSDVAALAAEGKIRSIMDKVAANVLKKITNINTGPTVDQKKETTVQRKGGASYEAQRASTFTFNTIVERDKKETRTIAVNDSRGWMNQLHQMARQANEPSE